MANLQEIRRRIASVKSTQKLTRAMKMVAAAKLRRAQSALMETRPYAAQMRQITEALAARRDRPEHPLLTQRPGKRVRLIVVTADRGLCGGFSIAIMQSALKHLAETFAEGSVSFTVIGRKGVELFRRRNIEISRRHINIFDKYTVNTAVRIIDEAVEAFLADQIDEVYCLYNEFKSAMIQRVALERMLPYIVTPREERVIPYIFEPSEDTILLSLLKANLYAQMHRILCESAASEQGARMSAMESATQNAGEVIKDLSLTYNRLRQDAITREVVEIISGAEAL